MGVRRGKKTMERSEERSGEKGYRNRLERGAAFSPLTKPLTCSIPAVSRHVQFTTCSRELGGSKLNRACSNPTNDVETP